MTIKETGKAIGKLIKAKMENPERRQVITPFIQGKPGIGKSALSKYLQKEFKIDSILKISLVNHDNTDLKGMPGRKGLTVTWLSPEFMPIEKSVHDIEGKFILVFLDEINRGEPDTIKSAFQLIGDYGIDTKELMRNCFVMCAGNLGYDDNTQVTELDSAFMGRVCKFLVDDVKLEDWLEWAGDNDISNITKVFLSTYPQYIYLQNEDRTISPRSWEQFDRLINIDADIEENIKYYGPGVIYELTNEFLAFMKTVRITGLDVLDRYSEIKEKLIKLDRPEIHNICSDLISLVKNNPVELTSVRATNLQTFFDNDLHDDNKVFLIREMKEANVDFITKWMESINELESVLTTTPMSKWWVAAMGLNEIDDFILQKVNIDAEIAEAIEQEEKKKLEEAAKA